MLILTYCNAIHFIFDLVRLWFGIQDSGHISFARLSLVFLFIRFSLILVVSFFFTSYSFVHHLGFGKYFLTCFPLLLWACVHIILPQDYWQQTILQPNPFVSFWALWMKMQVSFPYFGITVLTIRNCFAWTIYVKFFLFFLLFFSLVALPRTFSNFSQTRQLLNVTNPQSMCSVRHPCVSSEQWAVKAIS